MRIFLIGLGSVGDLIPILRIGSTFKQRGHQVTVLDASWVRDHVQATGLEFRQVLDDINLTTYFSHPEKLHPKKGFPVLAKHVLIPALLPTHRLLVRAARQEPILVIGTPWGLAGRLAQESHGIPYVNMNLAPVLFSHLLGMTEETLERNLKPALNGVRRRLRLKPLTGSVSSWSLSPLCAAGFFPSWFAPKQENWPESAEQFDFPLEEPADYEVLSEKLRIFLEAGPRPVVFTPGTYTNFAKPFFEAALYTCMTLGIRGIFTCNYPDQIPGALPETVHYEPFAQFSALLPRVSALCYHGGIGTCAEAMRAGIPHLVVPDGVDQFDNAERILNLGVGKVAYRSDNLPEALTEACGALLEDKSILARCSKIQSRLPLDQSVVEAFCERMEELMVNRREAGVPAGSLAQ